MALIGTRSSSMLSSQSLIAPLPSTQPSYHKDYTESRSFSQIISSHAASIPHHNKRLLLVSQKKLHLRRGISRGGGPETYREPLEDDNDFIPQNFKDSVYDAIGQFGSESGRSSPITAQYLEASNTNWTANLTGNTTDRSSSYSTDVFDKEASQNVQRLFDGIDRMLFESEDSSVLQLYDECKDWSVTFPHLRILGKQLMESSELGYHHLESPYSSRPYTSSSDAGNTMSTYLDSTYTSDSSILLIEGCSLKPQTHSASTTHSTSTDVSDMPSLHEEVFDIDGVYEDIIAIDSDAHEDPLDSKAIAAAQRQRRSRYPPITPNACAKDDITNSIFDAIWNILTDCMRILLQRYSEHFVITHPMMISAPEDDRHANGHIKLPQIELPGFTHRLDHSINPLAHNHNRFITGSVLSRPSPYNTPPPNHSDNLGKLLHISKMEMTERRGTFVEEGGSETPNGMKKLPPNRKPSATMKIPHRRKLAALSHDRVKTPSVDDEGLKGQGIAAVGKRLSSPPAVSNRSALPPINHSESQLTQEHHQTVKGAGKRANRASSAIATEKEVRPVFKDRALLLTETRPSTTHTSYPPTEQMMYNQFNMAQRSTTPLDRYHNHKVVLNITGNRLNHSQLDEEVEGRYDSAQWAPAHTGGAYRKTKLNSSFVR